MVHVASRDRVQSWVWVVVEQELHDLGVAFINGHHEWCFAARALDVDVGSPEDPELRRALRCFDCIVKQKINRYDVV